MIKAVNAQKLSSDNYIQAYKKYIIDLKLNRTIEKAITDDDFIRANQQFYLYYPKLFSSAFNVSKKDVALLCIAGYLYYQSTLFLDSVIDDKQFHKIAFVNICQEEAIKILTSIYGKDSVFWSYWNQRRNEYYAAIELEKGIHSKELVTIDDYLQIADYKASFGKAAIDTLFVLNNSLDPESYNALLKSHRLFSLAFQLNDDILDFKKDVLSGQFNWAHYLLKREPGIESADVNVLNKYIYIRGITSKIFRTAIDYLDKAWYAVEDIPVPLWKDMIADLRQKFQVSVLETDNYLEILTAGITSSSVYIINNSLSDSIRLSVDYIKSKQNKDGSWREYVNQGGISNVWSTAFIVSGLSGALADKYLPEAVNLALHFIDNNRIDDIWGYNSTWIEDADTTNFVLLSYLNNNLAVQNAWLQEWEKYQSSKGGFATYKNKEYLLEALGDGRITEVSGWCNAHHCVSAVSFYFMAKYDKNSEVFSLLDLYFDQISEVLEAYWWTSPIYTLYFLVKTYRITGDKKKADILTEQILSYGNEDGSFNDRYGKNDFYTGMALEILMDDACRYRDQIERSVDYLLKNQYEDGSWKSSHALQIPHPDNFEPQGFPYPVDTHGTNVRAKEFNRLFTTSTILKALNEYDSECRKPDTLYFE